MRRTNLPARWGALTLALLAALAACAPRDDAGPFTEEALARMDVPAMAAQVSAPSLSVPPGGGADAEAAWARLAAWAAEGVGGVLVANAPSEPLAARLDSARAAALPLLVVARLDRGAGGVLGGATELPALAGAAAAGESPAQDLGRLAGGEARAAGIHLALVSAPPFPTAEGPPPPTLHAAAEAAYLAYLEGLRDAGLRVGGRAFAATGEDTLPPRLRWDGAAVEAFHLRGLREAAPGLDAVEGAPVVLPALTGDTVPLPLSPVFAAGVLRRDLAFDGLVVADLADGGPLARAHGPGEAAVLALGAGADLLVGMTDPAQAIAAIVAAVEAGRVPRARLEAAARRVLATKAAAGAHRAPPDGPAAARRAQDVARARDAHVAAAQVLGPAPAAALRGCQRTALAVLPGTRMDTLAVALVGALPGLAAIDLAELPLRGPLVPGAGGAGPSPDCALVVRFAGLGPRVVAGAAPPEAPADTLPRRIVYLDFLPGAAWDAAGAVGAVVMHGMGDDAQHAAARIVRGGEGEAGGAQQAADWPTPPRLVRRAPAAAGMNAGRLAAVDAVVERARAQGVFTSAAVAVGYRGALVKLTGYGNVGGEPVDPASTVFDLASLTKVVGTASAVAALVDDGAVELDAPARRYLPEFRGGGRDAVTVRHLLTHTSGLPAGEWLFARASPEAALARVFAVPLATAPGEAVRYSDFGMMLLAEIVERQVEMPLDEFLARRVFGPLGMQSTFFLPPESLQGGIVPTAPPAERPYVLRGVVHDGNAYRLGGVTGHAGLFSTALDVSVFAQTMLNGGAYGPVRVFSEPISRGFVRRQPRAAERALGWETPGDRSTAGRFFSARSFGHTGYTGTSLWIDPETELFVVFLANRTFSEGTIPQMAAVRRALHDAVAQAVADRPVTVRPGARQ